MTDAPRRDAAAVTRVLLDMYGRDDWIMRRNFRVFLRVSGIMDLSRDARVLDLGCAMGHLVRMLQGEGFGRAVGVDSSREMVDAARRLTGAEILLGDAAECDRLAPAGSFDAVIVSDLVHHIDAEEGWERLLSACSAVLRPGGLLVIREPWLTPALRLLWAMSRHRVFFVGFLKSRLESFVEEDALLRHFFAEWPGTYRERLSRHGFSVLQDSNTLVHRITACRKEGA